MVSVDIKQHWNQLFKAELSPKRYWRRQRSQEVGGETERETIPTATLSPPEWFCIKMGNDESHFNLSLTVRGKVTRQCPQIKSSFEGKGEPKRNRTDVLLTGLKPVLNWANICFGELSSEYSSNIIRFLNELIVPQTWFRQFNELYFVLNWLMIRCKLRPELAAEAQQTASSKMQAKVKSSSQYTLIILHREIQLTNISFWVPETRLRLPQEKKKKRKKKFLRSEWST